MTILTDRALSDQLGDYALNEQYPNEDQTRAYIDHLHALSGR